MTNYFHKVSETLLNIPLEPIERIVTILRQARTRGLRIFTLGNGGSAANASHFVNDMVKSTVKAGMPRYRLICLSDNIPTLTAYANDFTYDSVFAEPLAALADKGDVVIALSGSGNSPNVLRAMDVAQQMGLIRIGLTGRDGGKLKDACEVCTIVPTDSMQVIEDAHLVILHAVFLELTKEE